MKKFLLIAFAFTCSMFATHAQFSIGAMIAGGESMSFNQNFQHDAAFDLKPIGSLDGGICTDYFLTDHVGFGFDIIYASYGATLKFHDFTTQGIQVHANGSDKIHASYLGLPASLKFKTSISGKTGFYFNVFIQPNIALHYSETSLASFAGQTVFADNSNIDNLTPVMATFGIGFGCDVAITSSSRLAIGPRLELFSTDPNAKEFHTAYTSSTGTIQPYEHWRDFSAVISVSLYVDSKHFKK